LKNKQRRQFLEEYIAKTIKRSKKHLKLKKYLSKNKSPLIELIESKKALFIETVFSDNQDKHFKIFKNLNKKEKKKIKQILEKGSFQAFELYPDNLSIAIHSSNATQVPEEMHNLVYPH
ncbi:MAG: hypothetical protein ABIG37_00930, partial [Nanoarchaeota archaeon]